MQDDPLVVDFNQAHPCETLESQFDFLRTGSRPAGKFSVSSSTFAKFLTLSGLSLGIDKILGSPLPDLSILLSSNMGGILGEQRLRNDRLLRISSLEGLDDERAKIFVQFAFRQHNGLRTITSAHRISGRLE